jgi:hypothetical protein
VTDWAPRPPEPDAVETAELLDDGAAAPLLAGADDEPELELELQPATASAAAASAATA